MITQTVRQCFVITDNLEKNIRWNVKQNCPPSSEKTIGTWNRYLSHMRLKSYTRKSFQTRYVHCHSDMVQKQININTDASYTQCLILSILSAKTFLARVFLYVSKPYTGATPAKNTANDACALRNALTACNTQEGTKRFSGAVWISARNGQRTS